jgi:hypothetical protein|nr:MAG TPA: hypothetical protein [Caudoviricetes sp.]
MPDKEELMRILLEQYGISSSEELEDAIRKQGRMDISAFVSREHIGDEDNESGNRRDCEEDRN